MEISMAPMGKAASLDHLVGDAAEARRTMPELTLEDLAEIEALAKSDVGEPCRGALLVLVEEVRRLRREVTLEPVSECESGGSHAG